MKCTIHKVDTIHNLFLRTLIIVLSTCTKGFLRELYYNNDGCVLNLQLQINRYNLILQLT